jgi:hypothetical protein
MLAFGGQHIVGAMDGTGYGAATAIDAIKSCAFGAPLRGCGTLTATPRSSVWHWCR